MDAGAWEAERNRLALTAMGGGHRGASSGVHSNSDGGGGGTEGDEVGDGWRAMRGRGGKVDGDAGSKSSNSPQFIDGRVNLEVGAREGIGAAGGGVAGRGGRPPAAPKPNKGKGVEEEEKTNAVVGSLMKKEGGEGGGGGGGGGGRRPGGSC